jgi:hypothetical protein
MRDVVVLGGYGRLGSLVVRELVETTPARVVAAGRSIQHAEQVASRHGERAKGAYADASDARTLRKVMLDAAAVIDCTGGERPHAIDVALELRVPWIGVGTSLYEPRSRARIAERAWQAQLPVVIHAGAVPGLGGVLCELLVRRRPDVESLCVASTGPWLGTETARRDVLHLRDQRPDATTFRERTWSRPPRGTRTWRFPDPIGERALRPAFEPDLALFPESNCVRSFEYLEPAPGLLERGFERVLGIEPPGGFALEAIAAPCAGSGAPTARISLVAADAPSVAAPLAAAIARAILARRTALGLTTPREAIGPGVLLAALEKRGLRFLTGAN